MKTLLIAAVAGVFLFAGSAAVSWYLMNQQQMAEEKQDQNTTDELDPSQKLPPVVEKVEKVDKMPVAFRPDSPITVESVMDLSRSIRKTEQKIIEREKQVRKDEAGIELMFEDLKRERDELTAFSTQIESKIRTFRELVEQIKIENQKLDVSKKDLAVNETNSDQKSNTPPVSDEIKQRVKVAKKYMGSMNETIVATYLKELADTGDLVFVGELLKSMDERKGSKVLEAIKDPILVNQILRSAGINN